MRLPQLHPSNGARKAIADRPGNVSDVVLGVITPLEGHHDQLLLHVHPNVTKGVMGTRRGEIGMEDGELRELARAVVDAIGGNAGWFPIGEGGEKSGFPGEGVRVGVKGEREGEGEEGDEGEEEEEEVAVPA